MPNSHTDHAQRLNRIGVTEDNVQALERIWNTEAFRLIADTRTGALADWGYNPIDSLDAIWHELDESTAHLYMQHGLTPHQAFLLDTNRSARANLWGPAADTSRVHDLLAAAIPRDILIKILATAATPEEAQDLITACGEEGADTEEETLANVESRPSPFQGRVDACDCTASS